MSDVVPMPPYDIEVEGALLCSLMREPERAAEVVGLRPEMFFSHAHALIHGAIEAVRKQGMAPERAMVASWLASRRKLEGDAHAGGGAYLDAIERSYPWVKDLAGHARVIRDKWRVRQLIARLQLYTARAYEEPGDGAVLFSDVVREVSLLATSDAEKHSLKDEAELIDEWANDIKLRSSGTSNDVPTGFVAVDFAISAMRAGELFVLAARPGLGKTTFALQVAANMRLRDDARGVLFFSYEMVGRELIQRYVATLAQVDLDKLETLKLGGEEHRRISAVIKGARERRLFVVEENDMTDMPRMAAVIRRVDAQMRERGTRLGLIIVDYLQLAADADPGKSRERDVAIVSRSLKSYSKEFGVPVLALAQMNRAYEAQGGASAKPKAKRAPKLSDLRESGAIEQDADAVLFLARNDVEKPSGDEDAEVVSVILAKLRRRPKRRIPLTFEPRRACFRDSTADEVGLMPKFDD